MRFFELMIGWKIHTNKHKPRNKWERRWVKKKRQDLKSSKRATTYFRWAWPDFQLSRKIPLKQKRALDGSLFAVVALQLQFKNLQPHVNLQNKRRSPFNTFALKHKSTQSRILSRIYISRLGRNYYHYCSNHWQELHHEYQERGSKESNNRDKK